MGKLAGTVQEEYVKGYQARVEGFWQHVVHPNAPDITLDQFKYGRSMVSPVLAAWLPRFTELQDKPA